jgi:hypothetical protein
LCHWSLDIGHFATVWSRLVLGPVRRSRFFDPTRAGNAVCSFICLERKVRTPQGRMPHELHGKCGQCVSRRADG